MVRLTPLKSFKHLQPDSCDIQTSLDNLTWTSHENIFCLLDISVDDFVTLNQVKSFAAIIPHLFLVWSPENLILSICALQSFYQVWPGLLVLKVLPILSKIMIKIVHFGTILNNSRSRFPFRLKTIFTILPMCVHRNRLVSSMSHRLCLSHSLCLSENTKDKRKNYTVRFR